MYIIYSFFCFCRLFLVNAQQFYLFRYFYFHFTAGILSFSFKHFKTICTKIRCFLLSWRVRKRERGIRQQCQTKGISLEFSYAVQMHWFIQKVIWIKLFGLKFINKIFEIGIEIEKSIKCRHFSMRISTLPMIIQFCIAITRNTNRQSTKCSVFKVDDLFLCLRCAKE